MINQNIYSLGLIAAHTKTTNKKGEDILIHYSVTLMTAMNNKPENEDYDSNIPTNGAQYVIKARKKDGSTVIFRRDNNEEVNLITETLDNPNHSFYQ